MSKNNPRRLLSPRAGQSPSIEILEARCLLSVSPPAQFGSAAAFDEYLHDTAIARYEPLFGAHAPPSGIGPGIYRIPTADVPFAFTNLQSTAGAVLTSDDFSHTNVQLQGVDEGDIAKTDGTYIYDITRQELVILRAWPAQNLSVVSRMGVVIWHGIPPVAESRPVSPA